MLKPGSKKQNLSAHPGTRRLCLATGPETQIASLFYSTAILGEELIREGVYLDRGKSGRLDSAFLYMRFNFSAGMSDKGRVSNLEACPGHVSVVKQFAVRLWRCFGGLLSQRREGSKR